MNGLPKRVRKRDGREVPFDTKKIADAIDRALRAAGSDPNRNLAEELASAVALSLSRNGGMAGSGGGNLAPRPRQKNLAQAMEGDGGAASPQPGSVTSDFVPDVEWIDELVERCLRETGRAAAAAAYVARRDERARARLQIAVHRDFGPRDNDTNTIRTASGTRSEPWSKGKIVSALMMEAELPRPLAEEIAAQVESRIFASGLRRISTSLLRELVDNELFTRGLETHLRKQALVGMPKYDLREGLRSGLFRDAGSAGELVAWTGTPEASIARTVLSRFSVEDVLPSRLADLHLGGELHFDGLDSPQRERSGALSLRAMATGGFPCIAELPKPRDLDEALDQLRQLVQRARRSIAGAVVLTAMDTFAQPWLRGGKKSRSLEFAERFLRALSLGQSDEGLAIHVAAGSSLSPHLLNATLLLLSQGYSRTQIPRLFIGGGISDVREALRVIESARDLAGGTLTGNELPMPRIMFGTPHESCIAPGIRSFGNDQESAFLSSGAAAILNLPRIAYLVPAWSEGRLLERVLSAVDDAVEGLAYLQVGLREMAISRGTDLPAPRRSFALGVVGLRECVRSLLDGTVDPRVAQGVMQAVIERTQAASAARGIRVIVEPWLDSRARGRFERLDADQQKRSSIFSDGDRVRYSDGATLSPVPGLRRGVAEADILAGLNSCVLPPSGSLEESWDFASHFSRVSERDHHSAGAAQPPSAESSNSREIPPHMANGSSGA